MAVPEPTSLGEMLDRLEETAGDRDRVALGQIVRGFGRRSFAPLLLLAGLIALSPLSGIPTVPTLVAVLVALIAGQLLLRRECFWLPGWLMRRSVSRRNFDRAVRFCRRPARWLDRWLRPRWTALTHAGGRRAVAAICLLISAIMPLMEILPFAATTTGAALTTFGLALVSHDGLVELIAVVLTVGTVALSVQLMIAGMSG